MKDIKRNQTVIAPDAEKKRITLRIDNLLLTQIKNCLVGQKAIGNYQLNTVSEFVRQALTNYQTEKLKLSGINSLGTKTEISLKLDTNLITFYQTWPDRSRSEILNKVLRGYLEQMGQGVNSFSLNA